MTGVDDKQWEESRRRLRRSYRHLVNTIEELDDWEREDAIGAPMAILAHSAKHLGAIHHALHRVR
ncbi:MAG: hypothetical protein JSW65_05595 [Candidatus Bipolaricaulota bacterium]|nr:MAG: hypothetical protein JSW65_05595 [Candidatus Bipolaricaulota bacterium]